MEFCDWGYTVVHPDLEQYLNDGKTWDGGGCPTESEDHCNVKPYAEGSPPNYKKGWNFTSGWDYHVIKCPTREIAAEMAADLGGLNIPGEGSMIVYSDGAADYRNAVYHAYWNDGAGGGTFKSGNYQKTAPNPGQPCFWHKNYTGPTTRRCNGVKP